MDRGTNERIRQKVGETEQRVLVDEPRKRKVAKPHHWKGLVLTINEDNIAANNKQGRLIDDVTSSIKNGMIAMQGGVQSGKHEQMQEDLKRPKCGTFLTSFCGLSVHESCILWIESTGPHHVVRAESQSVHPVGVAVKCPTQRSLVDTNSDI